MIELMVVFGVIVVLSGIVVGVANLAQRKAREGKAVSDLQTLRNALDEYRAEHGVYPYVGPEGAYVITNLTPMIERYLPADFTDRDPWGNYYYYWGQSKFACKVLSAGPNRVHRPELAGRPMPENFDDIVQ